MNRIRLLAIALLLAVAGPSARAQETCIDLPPGARAWWPADGTMEDVVGGHDAVDLGWAFSVEFSPGRVNEGFDFNAFDTGLKVLHSNDLNFDPTADYTLMFWMATDRFSQIGDAVLISKWRGFTQPFPYEVRLKHESTSPVLGRMVAVCWDETSTASVRTEKVLDDSAFHHVANVFSHSTMTLQHHIDGKLDSSASYTTPLTALANDHNLHFGIRMGTINPVSATNYRGMLDEIMIFDRALSTCEIAALHETGGEGVCRGDRDFDGLADYDDNCPDVANATQDDPDGDGVGSACDCAALNPAYGRVPPEVCMGIVKEGQDARLSWAPLDAYGGAGTRYDVLTGMLHELPVGVGVSEQCIREDLDALEAIDSSIPPPGTGIWYLVRADSQCGNGTWGRTSSDVERISAICF